MAVPAASPREDLFDRLLERRIVLVSGRLDDERATSATAQLMLLDATGDEPVDLRLSCPDGDLDASTALADTVELVGVTVRALCSGKVGGAALGPLAAADRRLSHRHCVFVLRDPTARIEGRADDLATEAAAFRRQLDTLHTRLAGATGQPLERVAEDMRRGVTLNADQAVEYGLVEDIIATRQG